MKERLGVGWGRAERKQVKGQAFKALTHTVRPSLASSWQQVPHTQVCPLAGRTWLQLSPATICEMND